MANYVYGDTNGNIVFDKKTQEERTYLGKEDGFNILRAMSDNRPDDQFYLIQNTDNYNELKKAGALEGMFKNHNVHFIGDYFLQQYPKAIEQTKSGDTLAEDALKVSDLIYSSLERIGIDGIITATVPSEMPFKGRTRDLDDPRKNMYLTDDWTVGAFLNDYILRSMKPLIAFHVDERFVYVNNELKFTNRIPDLILGFDEREFKITVPKNVYPNGTVSEETMVKTVNGTFANNDHISMLNYRVTGKDLKLGSEENFDEEHKSGPKLKIFYNQLKKNFTEDETSQFAFVDRLKLLNDFGLFKAFSPDDLQLYTNMPYNDQDIINANHDYFNMSLPKQEMIDQMYRTKYGLIMPNSKKTSMSQKIFENISIGVIPFYIQNDEAWYGSEQYTDGLRDLMPDFLGVKDAHEMMGKIEALENDPEFRQSLIETLLSNWDDGYVDGSVITDSILALFEGKSFIPFNGIKNPRSMSVLPTIANHNMIMDNEPKIYSIDGPKFSGKTKLLDEQIEKDNIENRVILHSSIHAQNDYDYFSKIHRGWLFYDQLFDNDYEVGQYPEAVYIDRSFISEHVYGTLWESTVNGTLADIIDDFEWPIKEIGEVYSTTNISIEDVRLLVNTYGVNLRNIEIEDVDKVKEIAIKNRDNERFNLYEQQTFKIANRIFKTVQANIDMKNVNMTTYEL